jgi:tetratricopeptide (TPR) repeat protein
MNKERDLRWFTEDWRANTTKETFIAYLKQGMHEEAIKVAERFKVLYPEHDFLKEIVEECLKLGKQLFQENKLKQAQKYFLLISELDEKNLEARNYYMDIQTKHAPVSTRALTLFEEKILMKMVEDTLKKKGYKIVSSQKEKIVISGVTSKQEKNNIVEKIKKIYPKIIINFIYGSI